MPYRTLGHFVLLVSEFILGTLPIGRRAEFETPGRPHWAIDGAMPSWRG